MIGLDKITERILEEGRERASQILIDADEDCKRIAADYAKRTDAARHQIYEDSVKECQRLVSEAREEAQRMHDEIIENARQSVVNDVIEGAKKKLCNYQHNKYRELMIALLSSALIEQDHEERVRAASEEDFVAPERYEVLMNEYDYNLFGESVVQGGCKLAERRIGKEKTSRVVLSDEHLTVDGGFLLRFDDATVDCSLDTLLTRIYEQMKTELDEFLFTE